MQEKNINYHLLAGDYFYMPCTFKWYCFQIPVIEENNIIAIYIFLQLIKV